MNRNQTLIKQMLMLIFLVPMLSLTIISPDVYQEDQDVPYSIQSLNDHYLSTGIMMHKSFLNFDFETSVQKLATYMSEYFSNMKVMEKLFSEKVIPRLDSYDKAMQLIESKMDLIQSLQEEFVKQSLSLFSKIDEASLKIASAFSSLESCIIPPLLGVSTSLSQIALQVPEIQNSLTPLTYMQQFLGEMNINLQKIFSKELQNFSPFCMSPQSLSSFHQTCSMCYLGVEGSTACGEINNSFYSLVYHSNMLIAISNCTRTNTQVTGISGSLGCKDQGYLTPDDNICISKNKTLAFIGNQDSCTIICLCPSTSIAQTCPVQPKKPC